jgi:hypothetical protein
MTLYLKKFSGIITAQENVLLSNKIMSCLGGEKLYMSENINSNNLYCANAPKISSCLLLHSNPRFEGSSLDLSLRRDLAYGTVQNVYVIGPKVPLHYSYIHLTTNLASLLSLCSSSSLYSFFNTCRLFKVIVGSSFLREEDSILFLEVLREFGCTISFVTENIGLISSKEDSFIDSILYKDSMFSVSFFFLTDTSIFFNESFFKRADLNIFVGSHYDDLLSAMDIVLPSNTIYEKTACYSSYKGGSICVNSFANSPSDSRKFVDIVLSFSLVFEKNGLLKTFCFTDSRTSFLWFQSRLNSTPHFQVYIKSFVRFKNGKKSTMHFSNLSIADFFLTNNITKASITLIKCSSSKSRSNYDS